MSNRITFAEWYKKNPKVNVKQVSLDMWRVDSTDSELWHLKDYLVNSQQYLGVTLCLKIGDQIDEKL